MKRSKIATIRHVLLRLLIWTLLTGLTAGSVLPAAMAEAAEPAATAVTPLTPEDLVYENGNIILHKHAERIGKDEWKVTVKATVGEVPVEKRKMEVVFVLDASGSMAWCTDEEAHAAGSHSHTWRCQLVSSCGLEEHEHTQEECYERVCGFAQEHTHTDDCYGYTCGLEEHEHFFTSKNNNSDCYETCTRSNNSSHWSWNWSEWEYVHDDAYPCLYYGGDYYRLSCTKEEHAHDDTCVYKLLCGEQEHTHSGSCYGDLTCPLQEHAHTADCQTYSCGKVECTHSSRGETPCTYEDSNGVTHNYVTRIEAAKDAISTMASGLPSDVDVSYVAFSSQGYISNNADAIVMSSYSSLKARGATMMMAGVNLGIDQFSDDESTKVLVVVTDGASEDGYTSTKFANFVRNGGVVYTVGFNHTNANLSGMAANGGSYAHAGNTDSLVESMDKIENALTAMLEDPMGTTVGFDKTSIQEIQTSGGVISSNDNTIYWHPAEDGSDTVRNSTIEYSYTVQLNEQADLSGGTHSGVPLNNPTNFLYGIKDSSGVTNMNAAAFPIPEAEYAISSVQTKWQENGRDIQTPTEVESIICDYASATYIPAFTQDYQTITPVIPISGTNDYYRYIGTTVTADGSSLPGVEAVDATEPVAYVVIHQYERVEANELAVGGTKTLIGRDFLPGDSFTFKLTAVTPEAPMPETDTVPIAPDSGSSMAFSFGNISFNTEGVYTYTIQEQEGSLDKVIYDTAVHTLVVTATKVGSEIVVSYTMDGVENGHLLVSNRLETGTLKVEKRTVTSHLPEHQEKAFDFLINIKDASNRPLSGTYQMQTGSGGTQSITFTNGFGVVTLKAGESAVILGLPDGAAYTVAEDAVGGFTATSSGTPGVIAANEQRVTTFDNLYQSAGLYQFIGRKTLTGATLELDQFSFSVMDEAGNVVARGKNNADGSLFLDTLRFTQDDIGTKTYTIVEDRGTDPSYIYDPTVYVVTLTIADNGDGTLSVTDDLNGQQLLFANECISHQLVIGKQVAGNLGSRNRAFSFTLAVPGMAGETLNVSTDGGATFERVTLDAQGETTFTLTDAQTISFYPVTGTYTVTETDNGGYVTTVTVDQGAASEGTTATGSVSTSGSRVDFVNTLEASPPTGVDTPAAAAIMCLCLAGALLAISLAGRRLVRDEE